MIFAFYAAPALSSFLVTGAAWLVSPGRRTAWWWAPAALVASISAALGLIAYFDHAVDVSTSRALGGAVIAAVASAVPLSVYYAIGRLVRDLAIVAVTWIATLMLLYPYAFLMWIEVVARTQCAPGVSDCPFG